MQRLLQNKIAESRWTLPVVSVYGFLTWMLCGLVQRQLWVPFVCFVVSTYLMVELNNRNALLRIYSRMVSVSFIAISMMMPFMLSSASQSIAGMSFIFGMFVWLFSYQDHLSMGKSFYASAFISLGSVFDVHLLYYVPLLWISMTFHLQTMSWRTFWASVFGTMIPYWFAGLALYVVDDPMVIVSHFSHLADITSLSDYSVIPLGDMVALLWIAVLVLVGSVHFVRNSFKDSIRIRMIFNMFIFFSFSSIVFILLMPTCYAIFGRVLIVVASPLIAHYISLTSTRLTNISFIAITMITLAITLFNLWTQLSPSL